ncbi:MAG: NDP-sugar synthase, partial [Clostridiales bacterium]|nr:NDP-sugar synthase [Clostridiales bacterium]
MCKAVIMAGGEGKRLRPITCTLPKPMVPLLNKPVIDYCIELLKKHGVEDITATLHYLPNVIMRHCGDGGKYGVKLSYSIEDAPLGTAGSVRKAVGADARRTIVISGDAMTDADLTEAMCFHKERGAAVTIVLKRVSVPTEYGVAMTDSKGKIYRFLEKPMLSEVFSDLANTGIYILEPEVIERIPEGEKYDFSKDLFPALLKEKMPVYGYVTDRYWCDIGDIAQYKAAQRDMLDGRCAFATAAKQKDGAWIEEGAVISEGAELLGPCYIGSGAEVSEAVVSDYSVAGSGARIGRGSSLKRTVLMENTRVRENVELR